MRIIVARVTTHAVSSLVHVGVGAAAHLRIVVVSWIDGHHVLLMVVAVWCWANQLIIVAVDLVEIHLLLVHSERGRACASASITWLPSRTWRERAFVVPANLRLRLLILFQQGLPLPLSVAVDVLVAGGLLVTLLPAVDSRFAFDFVLVAFLDFDGFGLSLEVRAWLLWWHLLRCVLLLVGCTVGPRILILWDIANRLGDGRGGANQLFRVVPRRLRDFVVRGVGRLVLQRLLVHIVLLLFGFLDGGSWIIFLPLLQQFLLLIIHSNLFLILFFLL